jgi:signal transduction histidine kinase
MQFELLERFRWQSAAIIVNAQLYETAVHLSEFKTRMIRMASHDLKNPLARIMGYTDLLDAAYRADTPPDAALRQKYVSRVIEAAEEMDAIIGEILNLEAARKGPQSMQDVDLVLVARGVVDRFEREMKDKSQQFMVDLPETLPMIRGDAMQLELAITNLLGNAVKYTPEGGTITMRIMQMDSRLRIAVADTGIGIAADEMPNLFREFFRVKSRETADISGTGLGLSLVKSIVEGHGGRVWAESQHGAGSTFTIELPLNPDHLAG